MSPPALEGHVGVTVFCVRMYTTYIPCVMSTPALEGHVGVTVFCVRMYTIYIPCVMSTPALEGHVGVTVFCVRMYTIYTQRDRTLHFGGTRWCYCLLCTYVYYI